MEQISFSLESDTRIRRYLDLLRFMDFLEHQRIMFLHPSVFDDPFEGVFDCESIDEYANKLVPKLQSLVPEEMRDVALRTVSFGKPHANYDDFVKSSYITFSKMMLVSCWNLADAESEAMWKNYSCFTGVAIETTVGQLNEFLPDGISDITKIKYVALDSPSQHVKLNAFNTYFHKRTSLSDENEARAFLFDFEQLKSVATGGNVAGPYFLPINVTGLVNRFLVSPFAEEWQFELIKEIVQKKYGYNVPVEKSNIRLPSSRYSRINKF